MKKILTLLFALSAINGHSQIVVDSLGKISIGTSSSPLSMISINCEGFANSKMCISGEEYGLRAIHSGSSKWGDGVFAESYTKSTTFAVGLRAVAKNEESKSSGRTYGVFADAGNATDGWNYALYGRLSGTNNGAAVYGTTTDWENGIYIDDSYAGYFNGKTKVAGDLTVTGSIYGVVLGNSSSEEASAKSFNNKDSETSYTDKIRNLKVSSYFIDGEEVANAKPVISGDTIANEREVGKIETQVLEKMHYGLNADQLKEAFPDLVYENEDGTSAINYMEMVPILVQTINELNNRIKDLESMIGLNAKSTTDINTEKYEDVMLCQNTPNPFNETTTISFNIPENSKSATIYFYDATGKQIKEIGVNSGKSSINISASTFTPGMYLYSLVSDGKIVSTKRMIVTK